jgi:hypothetical protein
MLHFPISLPVLGSRVCGTFLGLWYKLKQHLRTCPVGTACRGTLLALAPVEDTKLSTSTEDHILLLSSVQPSVQGALAQEVHEYTQIIARKTPLQGQLPE